MLSEYVMRDAKKRLKILLHLFRDQTFTNGDTILLTAYIAEIGQDLDNALTLEPMGVMAHPYVHVSRQQWLAKPGKKTCRSLETSERERRLAKGCSVCMPLLQ